MKYYYTLGQPFSGNERDLSDYFDSIGIEYKMGADYESDRMLDNTFLRTYVVLLEEEDLSAIQLSLDGVRVIKSQPYYTLVNKVRDKFKWILG